MEFLGSVPVPRIAAAGRRSTRGNVWREQSPLCFVGTGKVLQSVAGEANGVGEGYTVDWTGQVPGRLYVGRQFYAPTWVGAPIEAS